VRERVFKLHRLLASFNASLVAAHIKGEDNYVSDKLSRIDVGDQFQFGELIWDDFCAHMEYPTIDRFATAYNTLLPRFNSYFYEPNTAGIDAFA
jgi:hypothetical protein